MGAWIETGSIRTFYTIRYVAPRVGAWIETLIAKYDLQDGESHPVWVRGLKRVPQCVFATL